MKKSRILAGAAVVLAASLTMSACAGSTEPAETDPIKIGAVLDITGPGAVLGVPQQETLNMLAAQLNKDGGINGREVELIIEDNQSVEDVAAKAATKLIEEDGVDVLLGASRTATSMAMRPIAEAAEVPMISAAANAAIVADSDWVFKTAQNDIVVIQAMMEHMKAEGIKNVALLRDASAFGEGVDKLIQSEGKSQGVTLGTVEKFEPTATDFTVQLQNIKNSNPDAVIIWGINPAAALAQKAYRNLQIDVPVYHSHGTAGQAFLDGAGEAANGAIVPQGRMAVVDQLPSSDKQKTVIKNFIDQFTSEYGKAPNSFAGHIYDSWMVAVAALEKAGTGDSQAIVDAILGIKDYVGISGVFTFTEDNRSGLGSDSIVITEVENLKWVLQK